MASFSELGPTGRFLVVRVFPAVVLLVGCFCLSLGIDTIREGRSSRHWPTTTGVVEESRVEDERMHGERTPTLHARVEYRYEVDGRVLRGDRVLAGQVGTGDGSVAAAIVARYPVGREVTVFFDPEDPERALLEPGLHGFPWFWLLLGFPFAGFGALLAWFLPRAARDGQL